MRKLRISLLAESLPSRAVEFALKGSKAFKPHGAFGGVHIDSAIGEYIDYVTAHFKLLNRGGINSCCFFRGNLFYRRGLC